MTFSLLILGWYNDQCAVEFCLAALENDEDCRSLFSITLVDADVHIDVLWMHLPILTFEE